MGGSSGYVGSLSLHPSGEFGFEVNERTPIASPDAKRVFFLNHTAGRYEITHAPGIDEDSILELTGSKRVIATIEFVSSDGKTRAKFDIECDPATRRMKFVGAEPLPFDIAWNF